jgi:hypothetical protein
MADVTLTYKGDTIAELSESGSKTLETAGKYCEADILLEYAKSGGGLGGVVYFNEFTPTTDYNNSNKATFQLIPTIQCIVIVVATENTPVSSTAYGGYVWVGNTLSMVQNAPGDFISKIVRPNRTIGKDFNECSYNRTTGVLTIGGQYGTYFAGTKYRIYQIEIPTIT